MKGLELQKYSKLSYQNIDTIFFNLGVFKAIHVPIRRGKYSNRNWRIPTSSFYVPRKFYSRLVISKMKQWLFIFNVCCSVNDICCSFIRPSFYSSSIIWYYYQWHFFAFSWISLSDMSLPFKSINLLVFESFLQRVSFVVNLLYADSKLRKISPG